MPKHYKLWSSKPLFTPQFRILWQLLPNRWIWTGSLPPRAISGFLYSAFAFSPYLTCTGKVKWINWGFQRVHTQLAILSALGCFLYLIFMDAQCIEVLNHISQALDNCVMVTSGDLNWVQVSVVTPLAYSLCVVNALSFRHQVMWQGGNRIKYWGRSWGLGVLCCHSSFVCMEIVCSLADHLSPLFSKKGGMDSSWTPWADKINHSLSCIAQVPTSLMRIQGCIAQVSTCS